MAERQLAGTTRYEVEITTETGKATVEVQVRLEELARKMAKRALKTKSKCTTTLGGALFVRVTPVK